jgi:hypothetical protein
MIPGPYSICTIELLPDSDAPIYRTIKYGYDSASRAMNAREKVAKESEISVDHVVVIRLIYHTEAEQFTV